MKDVFILSPSSVGDALFYDSVDLAVSRAIELGLPSYTVIKSSGNGFTEVIRNPANMDDPTHHQCVAWQKYAKDKIDRAKAFSG